MSTGFSAAMCTLPVSETAQRKCHNPQHQLGMSLTVRKGIRESRSPDGYSQYALSADVAGRDCGISQDRQTFFP